MIAARSARKPEDDPSVRPDHEDAPLLKRIPLNSFVLVASQECANVIPDCAGREKSRNSAPETRQVVRAPACVGVDPHVVNAHLLLEGPGVPRIAGADHDEIATRVADLLEVGPQLGHLLTTQHSAEVADKHQGAGPMLPDLAKPMRLTGRIQDLDVAELAARPLRRTLLPV